MMKNRRLIVFLCAVVLSLAPMAQAASLTLGWNPNPERDVAGYLVSYGTQRGSQTTSIDVGNHTSQPIGKLVGGATYFFTVKAYNSSGMYSDSSQELSAAVPGSEMPPSATPAHLLDLNGDHRGDAFLYNTATGDARFELLTASGFTESVAAWDPGWQIHPADLNGDAYSDFFLYHPARGYWIQALNHAGDGTFAYTTGHWDLGWTVVPADLDGDGLTDLFGYNVATGVWVKSLVNGSGNFKGYRVGTWSPGWSFTTADLNGDHRDDFFLYNRTTGIWIEAFSQSGFGTFDYPASGQWDPGWQITPGDLNADGRADLFLLNAAGAHVSALSPRGWRLRLRCGIARGRPGWSPFAVDLNGDRNADLFLYNAATGSWTKAFSDGFGNFTYEPGSWDAGWTVAITEFNDDGRGDVMLSRAGRHVDPGDQHRRDLHLSVRQLGRRLERPHEQTVRLVRIASESGSRLNRLSAVLSGSSWAEAWPARASSGRRGRAPWSSSARSPHARSG